MAKATSNSGIETGSVGAGALDKAAAAAHSAVDRAIDAASPAAQWFGETTRAQQQRYDATAEYVRQNPVKAVTIAFVVGLLTGKILL